MSFAEDMAFDEYDAMDVPNHVDNEQHWKEGVHYDSKDNKCLLKNMGKEHLMSTISLFGKRGWNTTPLQEELNKRK